MAVLGQGTSSSARRAASSRPARRLAVTLVAVGAAFAAACAPGPTTEARDPSSRTPANAVAPEGPTTTLDPSITRPSEPVRPTTTTTPTAPTTSTPIGQVSFRATSTRPTIGGCEVFPPDHFLNASNIDKLPVHPSSDAWLNSMRQRRAKLVGPSSVIWEGSRAGVPINVVNSAVTGFQNVLYTMNVSDDEYRGQVPFPTNPKVEGYPGYAWDQHLLIVDSADCTAYELIQFDPRLSFLTGFHAANSGSRYSLGSTSRPGYTTNAPATPMIGQAYRVDEADAGQISHVVGFCSDKIAPTSVWPAQRSDGLVPGTIPMGAWARLKADVDLSRFSGQARAMVQALRSHGMVLTDTCAHPLHIFGENSAGWNETEMQQLQRLSANDFEIVDTSSMKVSERTFAVR